jgi:hypothetical protein
MKIYKRLAETHTDGSDFRIAAEDGKYGIWNIKTKAFANENRWATRKAAEDFLAVSLMIAK